MGCGGSVERYRAAPAAEARGSARGASSEDTQIFAGEWQYEETPDVWLALDPEIGYQLLAAWNRGESEATYSTQEGASFEVDFVACTQTCARTGRKQRIGWVPPSSSDSSVWEDPVEFLPAAVPSPTLGGAWHFEESPDAWRALEPEVSALLLDAWSRGESEATYSAGGASFDVDLGACLQTNCATGQQQRIGWIPTASSQEEETEDEEERVCSGPAAERVSERVALGGEWHFEETPDAWRAHSPEVSAQLLVAWYCGERQTVFVSDDISFNVDFEACVQTDQRTGRQQRIGWVASCSPLEGLKAGGEDDAPQIWQQYDEDEERRLLAAWAAGEKVVRYSARGCEYEADFVRMLHTNLTTGAQTLIGVDVLDESEPSRTGAQRQSSKGSEIQAPVASAAVTTNSSATAAVTTAALNHQGQPFAASLGASPCGSHVYYTPASPGALRKLSAAPVLGGGAVADAHGEPVAVKGAVKKPHTYRTGHKRYVFGDTPNPGGPGQKPAKPPPLSTSSRPLKKWSLAPGQQPRLAGKALPKQPMPMPSPKGRKPSSAVFELPDGLQWPSDEKARRVVEMLFEDMCLSRQTSLGQRRRAYRAMCLSWHPDKNHRHQALATEVFQFLQALKRWYVGA